MNEIKTKLNVSDYAFEIDGRNIVKYYLSYLIINLYLKHVFLVKAYFVTSLLVLMKNNEF